MGDILRVTFIFPWVIARTYKPDHPPTAIYEISVYYDLTDLRIPLIYFDSKNDLESMLSFAYYRIYV